MIETNKCPICGHQEDEITVTMVKTLSWSEAKDRISEELTRGDKIAGIKRLRTLWYRIEGCKRNLFLNSSIAPLPQCYHFLVAEFLHSMSYCSLHQLPVAPPLLQCVALVNIS